MKNSTKGFVVPVLILIIAVMAVGGIYLYNRNHVSTVVEPVVEVSSNSTATSSNPVKSTTTPPLISKTKTVQNVDQKNESPIILSVTTDKIEYSNEEPIVFTLTAHNSSTSSITLYFNSGCETFYTIGKFDSRVGITCTANIPTETILPNEKHTWKFTHLPSTHKLLTGSQKINVGITASGRNPFSGEILPYTLPLAVSATVKIIK